MSLGKKKERSETDQSKDPHELQSSAPSPRGKQGRLEEMRDGWGCRRERTVLLKRRKQKRLWKSRPKGTTDPGIGVQRQLFSIQEINLYHGSSAPSKQRQEWTTSAATTRLSKRLAQLERFGRDCPTEHQQRPLQSQGETRTTKARDSLDAARAGGGTDKSRRKQRTQTRGGGGPSECEAEAQSTVIPSAQ